MERVRGGSRLWGFGLSWEWRVEVGDGVEVGHGVGDRGGVGVGDCSYLVVSPDGRSPDTDDAVALLTKAPKDSGWESGVR